jgi:hypothetical protein
MFIILYHINFPVAYLAAIVVAILQDAQNLQDLVFLNRQ